MARRKKNTQDDRIRFGGDTPADDERGSEDADESSALDDEEKDYPVARPSPAAQRTKAGRNDPCPCGSGKKYKKCCWSKERDQPRGGLPEAKSFNELLKGAISETFQQPPRRREVRAVPKDTAYQIKITLNHTDPPIWRRVQLPDCTLDDLHRVIQIAMGWGDDHLHAYRVGKMTYSDSRMTEDPSSGVRHESSMTLSGLVEQGARKFTYDYDFGDSWQHEIEIEETLPEGKKPAHPVCIAGEKACPPEDCGGVWGYYEIVEGLKNPRDRRYAERLEWAGDYDPEEFDTAKINRRLGSL